MFYNLHQYEKIITNSPVFKKFYYNNYNAMCVNWYTGKLDTVIGAYILIVTSILLNYVCLMFSTYVIHVKSSHWASGTGMWNVHA